MVKTGLERLLTEANYAELIKGRRVGLLVNPNSVDRELVHAVDRAQAAGWNVVRLFGPEHGVRGEAQDMEAVGGDSDPITGLPCVSLYGTSKETLTPKQGDLEGIDVMVIDLQDIGARYYTYIYTAAFCAEACGKAGIDVVVCDRPNPIGGQMVEGNVVLEAYRSFVGEYAIATRHGMTFGELVYYFKTFGGLEANVRVVPMVGWQRGMWYDDTGLPWVMPSPNMPTLETAVTYPGQCLLEGTNLSEGRGTTRPFELFGAPWFDPGAIAGELTKAPVEGALYRHVGFKPMFQKWANQGCRGLQVHVTDRDRFESVMFSTALIQACLKHHGDDFAWRTQAYEFVDHELAIDLLYGDRALREMVEGQAELEEIRQKMARDREAFEAQRAEVLLY